MRLVGPRLSRAPVRVDGFPEPFFEGCLGDEAEVLRGTGRVEHAPGLTVGLDGIPDDAPGEAGILSNQAHKVFDGDLGSGPEG